MKMYKPTDKNIWAGRVDTEEPYSTRWHQRIRLLDLQQEHLPPRNDEERCVLLLGFESDEGVLRNKGRQGANQGPEALRNACANFAWHFGSDMTILDGGNVSCYAGQLEAAQQELHDLVAKAQSLGYFTLLFGGGHEIAWPHGSGLFSSVPDDSTLGIINIDAHFDLRPGTQPTSGTPFYQLGELVLDKHQKFNYLCMGIQPQSNTAALFNRAADWGVNYLSAGVVKSKSASENFMEIEPFLQQVDRVYLTICLDVFDQAFAPGVSAPAAGGLFPDHVLPIIREIVKTGKVVAADIAELNPLYDRDGQTARLAARLVYEILGSQCSELKL